MSDNNKRVFSGEKKHSNCERCFVDAWGGTFCFKKCEYVGYPFYCDDFEPRKKKTDKGVNSS